LFVVEKKKVIRREKEMKNKKQKSEIKMSQSIKKKKGKINPLLSICVCNSLKKTKNKSQPDNDMTKRRDHTQGV
jgi:hypothetical protein